MGSPPFERRDGVVGPSGVRGPLLVGMIILVGLIATTGIVALGQLVSTNATFRDLSQRDARLVKDSLEMKGAVLEQTADVRGFLVSGDEALLDAIRVAQRTSQTS